MYSASAQNSCPRSALHSNHLRLVGSGVECLGLWWDTEAHTRAYTHTHTHPHAPTPRYRIVGCLGFVAPCFIWRTFCCQAAGVLPIVSIVVPFFGLTNSILRILKGNPKKELQWRLQVRFKAWFSGSGQLPTWPQRPRGLRAWVPRKQETDRADEQKQTNVGTSIVEIGFCGA